MSANSVDEQNLRTHALQQYDLLNSRGFAQFDAIVELAANLCDTPMAALSFNDQTRERFVSCKGFSLDKIPAAKGFGSSVISGGAPVIVNDTRSDIRFRNAPLLQADPGVRFYAGAPVATAEGVKIGTLAVMDRSVRHLPREKLNALATLGTQLALLLESRKRSGSCTMSSQPNETVDSQFVLTTVFNSLPGLHWLMEPDGLRVVAVSDASLELFHSDRESVTGRRMEEVLRAHSDKRIHADVDAIINSMKRVARTGKIDQKLMFRYDLPALTTDGEPQERYWNIMNAPICDSNGKLLYVVNRAEDVTELMQLREREGKATRDRRRLESRQEQLQEDVLARSRDTQRLNEHLRMAQAVANVGSWEIGVDNEWRFWSDEVYTILGFNPQEHPPNDDLLMDAIHPEDQRDLVNKRNAAIESEGKFELTHRIVRSDGSVHFVQQQARLVRDGEGRPLKLHGTIQDITHQRQIEDELKTRARQQEVVVQLGQKALSGKRVNALLKQAVKVVARTLDVEYCKVLQLLPDNSAVKLVAGVGWKNGLVGKATVGVDRDSQAGYTLLSNKPVIVTDLRNETRFHGPPLLTEHGVISGISVTIAGKDGPWGVLGAHSTHPRTFTRDDVNFFESVANIIAEATSREHITRERDAQVAHHRALLQLTGKVVQGWSFKQLLSLATQVITEVLDVEYSNVKELLADGSGMQVVAGSGWQKGVVGHVVVASGKDSHGGYVLRTGKPVFVTDLPQETRFRPSAMLLDHGVDSSVAVMIKGADDPWGLVGAYTTRRRWFTQDEAAFLENIASILAQVGSMPGTRTASAVESEKDAAVETD